MFIINFIFIFDTYKGTFPSTYPITYIFMLIWGIIYALPTVFKITSGMFAHKFNHKVASIMVLIFGFIVWIWGWLIIFNPSDKVHSFVTDTSWSTLRRDYIHISNLIWAFQCMWLFLSVSDVSIL